MEDIVSNLMSYGEPDSRFRAGRIICDLAKISGKVGLGVSFAEEVCNRNNRETKVSFHDQFNIDRDSVTPILFPELVGLSPYLIVIKKGDLNS